MEDIFERFPTREAFDRYWNEKYVPLTYEDVREAYEGYVSEVEKKIFLEDYQKAGVISGEDFIENLNQISLFTFQDTLTEAFYEKNEELYETAFMLYEAAQLEGQGEENVAMTFHEEYNRLYQEFLHTMFDKMF